MKKTDNGKKKRKKKRRFFFPVAIVILVNLDRIQDNLASVNLEISRCLERIFFIRTRKEKKSFKKITNADAQVQRELTTGKENKSCVNE